MKKKKSVLVVLSLVLCICWTSILSVPVSAEESDEKFWVEYGIDASPYYLHTKTVTLGLEIDSAGKATAMSSIVAMKPSYTTLIVTKLQQLVSGSYKTLNTWSEPGPSANILVENHFISKGYKYRVASTFYVYDNGSLVEMIDETYERKYE